MTVGVVGILEVLTFVDRAGLNQEAADADRI